MATRSQQIRAEEQRQARKPRPPQPKKPRRDTVVDTAKPGVSATDRRAGAEHTSERNRSNHAGRKGGASLEDSMSGKPSRKSTRGSAGHLKRSTSLQQKAVSKTNAPSARAASDKAKRGRR